MERKNDEKANSLDNAIKECKEIVLNHRSQSKLILYSVSSFLILLIATNYVLIVFSGIDIQIVLDSSWLYIAAGFVMMVFGVLMSIYRFHLKETAKYEHLHIGFLRIRVAGNNTETGYQTEVRKSLTENAFLFDTNNTFLGTNKKVKNPLPGHPTSDISTLIINKLLDNIEFQKKDKPSKAAIVN
ncbi:hypothetical protein [Flavivirga eckloniae]|uniref:Uncharacterized protein n=1 Tax=Flavivirga eckloniae TaxID=1803846 RepID=A0A2K9PLJ1_9FLAO|nr:hypothetical protein [Flavivirga eckloniae]AUP77447.1 hypothetical protein C1H87_01410 [Flavivirga eckloniae]